MSRFFDRRRRARRGMAALFCAAAGVAISHPAALAASKSYSGPNGGLWSNASNWSLAGVPVAGDVVQFFQQRYRDQVLAVD